MQTKSYRLAKWTLLACVSASLASACVVTTGSGSDDFFDGGEGGSSTTAGTSSTGGAGTSSTAGTGGSSTTAGTGGTGTTAGTSAGGEGGGAAGASNYVPGLCDSDSTEIEGPTPTVLPSADLNDADMDAAHACRKCMKEKCTDAWQICYGSEPTIACGNGPTDMDPGQFDCVLQCFQDGAANPSGTADELLQTCSDMCVNQCDGDGGNLQVHTSDLITCANDPDKCQADCFSF